MPIIKKKEICKYCKKKVRGPVYRYILNPKTGEMEPAHPSCHDGFVRGDLTFWIKKI